jgi:hypothetical protein
MTRWRSEGFTKVMFKGRELGMCLRRDLYQIIAEDWKAGKTFGEYEGIYGFKFTIKFAEVQTVMDCAPEAIEAEDVDDRVEAERNKFE